MTDKQIKEEIKQVVTNLGNIKFTVEDELEFCKEVLKHKEQECDQLKVENDELKRRSQFEFDETLLQYSNMIEELKQALQEIKDIAEAITNGTHFTNTIEEHLKEMVKQIINKINEVEDEI